MANGVLSVKQQTAPLPTCFSPVDALPIMHGVFVFYGRTIRKNANGYKIIRQWRRQLWGTGARVPFNFQQFHF